MHLCPVALSSHEEGRKMLAQPSQGIRDFSVPSGRVTKEGKCTGTREGRRHGRFTASPIAFIPSFAVPGVSQKAPVPGVL